MRIFRAISFRRSAAVRTLVVAVGIAMCRLLIGPASAGAQDAPAAGKAPEAATAPTAPISAKAAPKTAAVLADDQLKVAEEFRRFEQVIKLLSQFPDEADEDQVRLLRQVFAEAQSRSIDGKFDEVVKLIKTNQLGRAAGDHDVLRAQLEELLAMMLAADRGKELKEEQARIRDYVKRIKEMITKQLELQGKTAEGDPKAVSPPQGKLAGDAYDLVERMARGAKPQGTDGKPKPGEGKPGEGKPGEAKPGEGKPGEGKPGEGKPGEGKPGEGKPGEGKPGEGKPGEAKPGESKPGESKPGEAKPGEAKPGEAKPGEGKPSEGKPGEGKPGEGKPSQGKPGQGEGQPGEPGEQGDSPPGEQSRTESPQRRVAAAQKKMEEAQKKLEKAERDGAMKEQEEAVRELEKAKAELEEILRQLREEELARLLDMLEKRFAEMLRMQESVYRDTQGVHAVPVASRGQGETIEAGRLSREEGLILVEADKALNLLKEEGSAVAFPKTVEAMRDDVAEIAELLADVQVDELTLAMEEDVIATLKELIEALKKAKKDLKEKQQQGKPQQGQQGENPLVDKIAELKMIRSLQLRVNRRTKLIAETADVATNPKSLEMLRKLAATEQEVFQITRDIVLGKNQ
jgi:hypothetical protein